MRFSKYRPMYHHCKHLLAALLLFFSTLTYAQIVGNTEACPGSFEVYTYTDVNVCDTNYIWTISPPIGVIMGQTNNAFIGVEWNGIGTTQVCLSVEDSCNLNLPVMCTEVNVESIPETNVSAGICDGDCFEIAGQSLCAPGIYPIVLTSSQGCDSVINVSVAFLPTTFTNLGDVILDCDQPVFEICGQIFQPNTGTQTAVCVSSFGCDSIITFNPISNVEAPIADPGPAQQLDCTVSEVTLDGSFSSIGPEFAYEWIGPNGFTSTGITVTVSEPGPYCLTVINTTTGCETQGCTVVDIDDAVPLVTIANGVLPCDGSPLTLNSTYTGGGPSVEFQWTTVDGNIISGQNTLNPIVDAAGTYCLTVTNTATGCSGEACAPVFENPQIDINGLPAVCLGGSELYVVSLTSNAGTSSFSYSVNGGAEEQILVSGSIGTILLEDIIETSVLEVWTTDSDGCESDTASLTITPVEFDLGFEVENFDCQPTQVSVLVNSTSPIFPYEYDWSTGENVNQIGVLSSGEYFVTVSDANGCSDEGSVFVTVDYTGQCAFIEGNVLNDVNIDCLIDASDVPLDGWLVEASIGTASFYATTDAAGFYSLPVDPGSYVVSIYPATNLWEPCENGIDASPASIDEIVVVDFLVEKLPGCPQMTVDISSWLLRRCFSNNYYNVSYCNLGTEDALDAYVELQVDEFLNVLSASIPFQDLGDDLYRFEIGDVAVNECGTFNVNVEVSCDAVLGQTHCTEAHIFPDTLCGAPDPNWSGADLETQVECSDSVYFTITNTGTGTMSEPLQYVVIEDAVMYMEQSDGPPLGPGEEHTIAVPANGSTWRLEVTQEPFHPSESDLQIALFEACGVNSLGGISTGFVEMFSQFDEDEFIDVDCRDNIGAYDPNDKQGFPRGYGDDHYILPGTDIEYLIRFQNTGTDTAFNIVIRDTLVDELNVTTVRPGASSHPYEFEIYGDGILKFTFPDIMLPDSNVNEPLSHGYVEFKVSHVEGLDLGTVIENSAAIYFDFNEPIITNTTDHELAVDFPMVNRVEVKLNGVEMEVFPNPFDESFQINLSGIPFGKNMNLTLLDAVGRLVKRDAFMAPNHTVNAENFPSGIYFFKVEMDGELVAFGKLMKG